MSRDRRATLALGIPVILLLIAFTAMAVAGPSARAQEDVDYASREEIVDAIMRYAVSGGCATRRHVFGHAFDLSCKAPDADGSEHIRMMTILDRLPERELVALCGRNGITDCERPREASKGRSVLTFESAFDVEFNARWATWSPDARLLLLDSLNLPVGEVRLLDVAAGRLLGPPLYAGPIHDAAWSPDGTYIALSERKRADPEQAPPVGVIRLYSSSTREERGSVTAADAGCSLGFLEGMAFTADAKALWVLCGQSDKTAKAVKLRVPELEIEDSFVPASPIPGWSESYWEEGVLRFADDLILTTRFRSPTPVRGLRSAVQSYSLHTRQPVYAPIYVGSSAARLTGDMSGVFLGDELWSTRTGQRIATAVKPDGRYLGAPNRLPQLAMHIEARRQPKSQHSALLVLDSASGKTLQEIGPVPTIVSILVSPDGSRVAVASFQGIRFYRVSPDAMAARSPQGR